MIGMLLSQLWVQRLGWTLLHFLWQGTAIAVVYAMLRKLPLKVTATDKNRNQTVQQQGSFTVSPE